MRRYKSILLIAVVLLGWFFLKSQKKTQLQQRIPTQQHLENHTWILVSEKADQASGQYITRKLTFTGEDQFEVIETFKFSGSTFRNRGKYNKTDSLIRLKSSNGRVHIANLKAIGNHRLRIEWLRPRLIHGKGSEIYQTQEQEEAPKRIIFSSRLFKFLESGN
ncbi:MAG TPA: hypothetical protein VJ876_00890 [Bacteroidales bacterium]|nr:hypothetical protein [Bacteroidales bacterium]